MISKIQKISLCLLLAGGVVSTGVGVAVNQSLNNDNSQVQAASTTSVSYIKIQCQDQINWSSQNNDPTLHMWGVTFVSGSGYTSLSDVSEYGYTVNTTDSYINVVMTWSSLEGSYRNYVTELPWYINSISYKFFIGSSWPGGDRTAKSGEFHIDYVYGSTQISATTSGTTASKDVNTYSITYKNGDSTLCTVSDVKASTLYSTGSETYTMPEAKELSGWYSDSSLTTLFAAKTKISADTTIYGKFIVTAASFNTWILSYESGDKTTTECGTKYAKALSYYNSMTSAEQTTFSTDSTYSAGYTRWQAWQRANPN